jgi:hypothetical protein
VVYDFADSRAGEHARTFLANWQGKLVCDDYGGYVAAEVMLCRVSRSRRTRDTIDYRHT